MVIYDIRNFYIIYSLLNAEEQHPISSNKLSEELSLSNKTIQNSIMHMSEYCEEHGFHIISKSGNGFYCKIFDVEKASFLRQNLTIYFSKNHLVLENDSLELGNLIIYILNKDSPVTVTDLCDKFYFSKSKIYSYISKAAYYVNGSGMELVNDRNKGIIIHGDEFVKRMYIASCIGRSIFQYDIENLFGSNFHFTANQQVITNKIIHILRIFEISLDDEKFNAFLVYLTYSNFRYQRYDLLETKTECIHNVIECREYLCAKELAKILSLSYKDDDKELAGVAAYLLTYNDHIDVINVDRYGEYYYSGILALYEHLNAYTINLNKEFSTIPEYQSTLMQLAYHNYFLSTFHIISCSFTLIEYNLAITSNALIRYLTRLLCAQISDYFNENLSYYHSVYVTLFAQNLLYSVQLEKTDIQILLILKEGNAFCGYIINWLKNHLKPTPAIIEHLNLAQVATTNLDKYDLILTNYSNLDYVQQHYKVYKISDPLDDDSSFINEYFHISNMRNISLEQLIHHFSELNVYKDCQISNTNDFIQRVDNDLDGYGDIPFRQLRKLSSPINYYSGNKVLVVPFLYQEKGKHENILSIYFNDKKKHQKYDILVFFSMYSNFGIISLIRIMNICNEFSLHPDVFYRLEKYLSSNK